MFFQYGDLSRRIALDHEGFVDGVRVPIDAVGAERGVDRLALQLCRGNNYRRMPLMELADTYSM